MGEPLTTFHADVVYKDSDYLNALQNLQNLLVAENISFGNFPSSKFWLFNISDDNNFFRDNL